MVFRRIIESNVIRTEGRSLIKDQSVHSYVVVFNVLINRSFDERVFFFFFFFFLRVKHFNVGGYWYANRAFTGEK